jgi:hypothetical protein
LGGGERWRPRGRHLAQRLAAAGESVVDVPPKLSARVRVLSSGIAHKNDGLDALATALVASRNERLEAVDQTLPSVTPTTTTVWRCPSRQASTRWTPPNHIPSETCPPYLATSAVG